MAKKIFIVFTNFVAWLARVLFPFKVYGKENLLPHKSIVVCNHVSSIDAVSVFAYTKRVKPICFLYKAELDKVKLFKALFTARDFVPVHRGSNDLGAYKKSLAILKADRPLGIFPEGTRNKGNMDDMLPLRTGATLYAIKTKSPIVPCYIWNTPRLFRRNRLMIGESFELSEFYGMKIDKEMLDEATAIIREKMYEVRHKLDELLLNKGIKRKPNKEYSHPVPSDESDVEEAKND